MDNEFVYLVKRLFPFALVAFIIIVLLAVSSKGDNCKHDKNTVEFWEEEYKSLPAETLRVEGNEITVAIKGKYQQKVYVLHKDKKTDPPKNPTKGKWYVWFFCRKCNYLFGYNPL